jgi:hypothetical protein
VLGDHARRADYPAANGVSDDDCETKSDAEDPE